MAKAIAVYSSCMNRTEAKATSKDPWRKAYLISLASNTQYASPNARYAAKA